MVEEVDAVIYPPFPTLYSIFDTETSVDALMFAEIRDVESTESVIAAVRGIDVTEKFPDAEPDDGETLLLHEDETEQVLVPLLEW